MSETHGVMTCAGCESTWNVEVKLLDDGAFTITDGDKECPDCGSVDVDLTETDA